MALVRLLPPAPCQAIREQRGRHSPSSVPNPRCCVSFLLPTSTHRTRRKARHAGACSRARVRQRGRPSPTRHQRLGGLQCSACLLHPSSSEALLPARASSETEVRALQTAVPSASTGSLQRLPAVPRAEEPQPRAGELSSARCRPRQPHSGSWAQNPSAGVTSPDPNPPQIHPPDPSPQIHPRRSALCVKPGCWPLRAASEQKRCFIPSQRKQLLAESPPMPLAPRRCKHKNRVCTSSFPSMPGNNISSSSSSSSSASSVSSSSSSFSASSLL